jgi:cation diffusion facilitator family transporter
MENVPREMPTFLAFYVTIASIAGKIALAWYQSHVGKRTGSLMLQANGRNMLGDVIISVAVLVGLFFTYILKMPYLDTVTALAVSLWIMFVGYRIFMASSLELMDGVEDAGVYERIFTAISKVDGASNPHRARVRKVGHRYLVAVDVEVNGDITVNKAHFIAHQVEEQIKAELVDVYDVMVHTEPVGDDGTEEKFGISMQNLQKLKKNK